MEGTVDAEESAETEDKDEMIGGAAREVCLFLFDFWEETGVEDEDGEEEVVNSGLSTLESSL